MSLIKSASLDKEAANALMRHFHELSGAAQQAAGKAGMVRSQRRYIMGHIAGNTNIQKELESAGAKVHFHDIKKVTGPMTVMSRNGGSDIFNLDQTPEVAAQMGGGRELLPHSRKAETFLRAVVKRHEMREASAVHRNYKALSPEQQAVYNRGISGMRKAMLTNNTSTRAYEATNNVVDNLDHNNQRFSSHMDVSIPVKDLIDTNHNPHAKMTAPIRKLRDQSGESATIDMLRKRPGGALHPESFEEASSDQLRDLTHRDVGSIRKAHRRMTNYGRQFAKDVEYASGLQL